MQPSHVCIEFWWLFTFLFHDSWLLITYVTMSGAIQELRQPYENSEYVLVGAFMALTLTMLSPAVLANDNNDIRKTVVVKFAKKAYSANYYGRLDGYKYDSYKFYAKKGQKLKVTLTGGNVETYLWGNQLKDSINLGEYSPELDDNGVYILPASGEYEIRVLQPRSQARKDKKPQYWMSINIK